MLCSHPWRQGVFEYACGGCWPCRINRRRLMTSRLLLEQREHDESCFLTLTIRDECLPIHGVDVSVQEAQGFLKRLRVAKLPRGQSRRFRYYLVGEYGESGGRAHYHVALFGFSNLGLAAFSWPHGFVQLDELNARTAAYICGYVAEKGSPQTDARVAGRRAEFARMSLGSRGEGGLGAVQADRIAKALGESDALSSLVDVPSSISSDGKSWPLGRYLQGRIRQMVGFGSRTPEEVSARRARDVVAEVAAVGSTTKFSEARERRRAHDAVKAQQRVTRSSKLMKGKLK